MSTLYIDCSMGITAPRLLGALIDLHEDKKRVIDMLNDIGMEGLRLGIKEDAYKGIRGKRVEFMLTAEREAEEESGNRRRRGRTYREIIDIIDDLSLSGTIRRQIISIYDLIGDASAAAKNKSKDEIYFNRTGSRDIIFAVAGVCMLLNKMKFDKIYATPVAVGTGYARTSLGEMPIPIPSIKILLDDMTYYAGNEEGETASQEGVALLRQFAEMLDDIPDIKKEKTGGGFGNREFTNGINCVRVYIGEPVKTAADYSLCEIKAVSYASEDAFALALEKLKELGVFDAYVMQIKGIDGTNGVVLNCICENNTADKAALLIMDNAEVKTIRRVQALSYK